MRFGHHCAHPIAPLFGIRSSDRASVGPTTTREEIDRFVGLRDSSFPTSEANDVKP